MHNGKVDKRVWNQEEQLPKLTSKQNTPQQKKVSLLQLAERLHHLQNCWLRAGHVGPWIQFMSRGEITPPIGVIITPPIGVI